MLAGFVAALTILAAFTWLVGWQDIITTIIAARTGTLLAGALVSFTGILLLGVSWWIMVKDVAMLPFRDGISVFLPAQFMNAITPLGQLGGEPFIAYLVSQDADIPIEDSFGAILAADLLNTVPFFTLSLTGIIIFLIYTPINGLITSILKIVLGIAALVALAVILIWRKEGWTIRFFGELGAILRSIIRFTGLQNRPKLGRINRRLMREKGKRFSQILKDTLRQPRKVAAALTITHIANLLSAFGLYLIILALGVDAPISALLFLLPAAMLAGYLPLPGGLGGIEVALTLLLIAIIDLPASIASAAVLLFRFSTYWTTIFTGGVLASQLSIDMITQLD